MNGAIYNELLLLGMSLAVGLVLMILYDLLRIFRIFVTHGTLWTSMEDVIYWIICSLTAFLLLFRLNDGILRWYAVGGVLAGMLFYNVTVSRTLLRLLKKIKKYFTIRGKKRRKKREASEKQDAGERKSKKKEEGKPE